MLDQRSHHAHRRSPRAVRGRDRLDDVFEDGLASQQAARAYARPREVGVLLHERVEIREILVEAENVTDPVQQHVRQLRLRGRAEHGDRRPARRALRDAHRPGLSGRDAQSRLEGASVLVDPVRRKVSDAVGGDRPPEIHRLAARADEGKLSLPGQLVVDGSYGFSHGEISNASPGVPPRQRMVVPSSPAAAPRIASGSGT
jgi:hypothetical protein